MQLDAGMGQQPPVHHRCLAGGQVVADHVDGQAGLGLPVDLIQEVPEVDGPVPGGQLAGHLAGGGVQRGEQVDGAVPDVIMAAPPGGAGQHGQHRGGPFQGLVIRGNHDQAPRSRRSRCCVRIRDGKDNSGSDKRPERDERSGRLSAWRTVL